MKCPDWLKRPPWRTVVPLLALLMVGLVIWAVWAPGQKVTDGRHDRGRNGIWLQHGWLGHDSWFTENNKTDRLQRFRDVAKIRELATMLRKQGITDVYPHLCPTRDSGAIMPVDDVQTERFLKEFAGFRVMPWIGGVFENHVDPKQPERRKVFIASVVALFLRHPNLAGVHLNVEPWPSGNQDMLIFLDELRVALPPGKILSVAAYPPPTVWHPFPEIHWDEAYFKEVARRVDQMAVMMYDTALREGKLYQALMDTWTRQELDWAAASGGSRPPEILLGVPTYGDAGVGYHYPEVENLTNALPGIHAALDRYTNLPAHYQGIAIYCEWETDEAEWEALGRDFLKRPTTP